MPTPARKPYLRLAILIGLLLVGVIGAVLLHDRLSLAALQQHHAALIAYRDAHYLATVLVFIAAYVTIVALSLPGATASTLTGGFLFGLFPGMFFNVAAAGTGACVIFLAARWGLGAQLSHRIDASPGKVQKFKAGIERNQWSVLFLMRLVPGLPFFVVNLIPAFLRVPLWIFAVTTFVGILPGALVFTSIGSGLGAVFESGESLNLSLLSRPEIFLPFIGLALLAALPLILKLVRGRAL